MVYMKSYYYLDSVEGSTDIIFFKIKTDVPYDKLLDFFYKKALIFCENENIDAILFLDYDGNYNVDYYIEIEIEGIVRLFSLRTCLDKDFLKTKLKRKFEHQTFTIKIEDLV